MVSRENVSQTETENEGDSYKVYDLRHLHLGEDTSRLVRAKPSRVADGESVGSLYRDFARLTAVQFRHALNFSKSNEVAVFKSMTRFVQTCNEALFILLIRRELPRCAPIRDSNLFDGDDHPTQR